MPHAHPKTLTPREVWEDPEAFATCLTALLLDTYGTEALSWIPDTVLMEVEEDFHVHLPPANADRLLAGCRLLADPDAFYRQAPSFIELCLVLSGHHLQPGVWVPADAAECAWGVTEAYLLAPPDDEDNAFSDEVRHYVAAACREEGIMVPPDVLRVALYDEGLPTQIQSEFADDPDLFKAIWDTERKKSDGITRWVRDRLSALLSRLESLPLRTHARSHHRSERHGP